ncbi:hypothetical protein FRC11_007722, partial [Ceratobasidium sp. 423]
LFTDNSSLLESYAGKPVEFRSGFHPLPVFFPTPGGYLNHTASVPIEDLSQEIKILQGQVYSLLETANVLKEELGATKGELDLTKRDLNGCRAAIDLHGMDVEQLTPHPQSDLLSVEQEPEYMVAPGEED